METAIVVAAKTAIYTVQPVGQWVSYSFHYNKNIANLRSCEEELQNARERVRHCTTVALNNSEEIEADVNNWLKKVDEIIGRAREVLECVEKVNSRPCIVILLSLRLRHKLSRKAIQIIQDTGEVLKKGSFDKVSYRPALQGIVATPCTYYLAFESRVSIVVGLMEALGDTNLSVIGIWGMAGVGKTTLAREVARQAKEENLFDEVAIADVTQSPDIRRIQGEIADMLDLKLDAETEQGRATQLHRRLTKGEKVLVILDDIWKSLGLEKIGIPSKGCKVLLISRNRDVLFCQMDIEKDFGLEKLPENEAQNLFDKMVGDSIKDPGLKLIAKEIAKECAGLPIALVTISKALKNKELYAWKNALRHLQRPVSDDLTEMQSIIYSSIELSYRYIDNRVTQHFFLHCAEMHNTISYEDLLRYCYGLGLFLGVSTLEDARNRLYTLVRNLKDFGLLLDSPHSSEYCQMHDVVRDVARLIAAKDHSMIFVGDDDKRKKWPDMDLCKRCEALYMYDGDIPELPNGMEFPELRSLCVNGGHCSLQVRDTFFRGMGRLRVLDFKHIQLSSLPTSFSQLINLQTLCLDHCALEDISMVGSLKNLAILSLRGSIISQLPKEIGLLTHLQLLDLSNCLKLKVIPPEVLPSLVELEELYMGETSINWEIASLSELKLLSRLMTLEMHIQRATNLPKDLWFDKLEKYIILVGDTWDWPSKHTSSKTLKLKGDAGFQSGDGINILLKRTESLYLDALKDISSVLHELDREGLQNLKRLQIQNSHGIKYLIDSRISVVAFPILEKLLLKNMSSLERICQGQLPSTSLCYLRVVIMEHCNKLKFFISSSIADGLSQLEALAIRKCNDMVAIVMKEEGEIEGRSTTWLPQLHTLEVEDLPKLRSFLSIQNSITTDTGEIMSEGMVDSHMPILHEEVVFPKLERLKLLSIDFKDVWHNKHCARSTNGLKNMPTTSRFQCLSVLHVQGSSNIKHLLTFSTAKLMVQLKHLQIWECCAIEEIIATEEIIPKILFPQLKSLLLKDLPVLQRFCMGNSIEFPFLKTLKIQGCPKLKMFICKPLNIVMEASKELKETSSRKSSHKIINPFFNQMVAFPTLEDLELSHMVDLKIIWNNEFVGDSFSKLRRIKVQFCESTTNIFPSTIMARFQNLEELWVTNCGSLEEIFKFQGWEKIIHKMLFPQLEWLSLNDLPILQIFCMGTNVEFPSLKRLMIDKCPRLKTFMCKHVSSDVKANKEIKERSVVEILNIVPCLKTLKIEHCPKLKIVCESNGLAMMTTKELMAKKYDCTFNNSPGPLFNEMVAFPSLETLKVSHMVDMRFIWQSQFAVDSFHKLQSIKIQFCENLTYVFPSNMLMRIQSIKKLKISDCGLLQEIVELQGLEEMIPQLSFLQLKRLFLENLPNLQRFCVGSKIEFPSLKNVRIEQCPRLETFICKPTNSSLTTSNR